MINKATRLVKFEAPSNDELYEMIKELARRVAELERRIGGEA